MYVCICNGVTDRAIREVAAAGCRTLPELTMRTGCGATCGSCLGMAQQILDEVHAARALDVPVLDAPAPGLPRAA
jgi:bacterioferritin-associated ferredoxin